MNIDFKKGEGLVPVIVQDALTLKVLMLGYMNEKALMKTQDEGKVTFYSRSRQRLWTKGEESGNFFLVQSIKQDCDADTLLISVNPVGPACHKGTDTCFDESNQDKVFFINHLKNVIRNRKHSGGENSYTRSLFEKGINKVAQKVGEEAIELVIESKDENKELFLGEAADLLFHYLVLLEAKSIDLNEVLAVLMDRHKG